MDFNNKYSFHINDFKKIKMILHSHSTVLYVVKISFLSYNCVYVLIYFVVLREITLKALTVILAMTNWITFHAPKNKFH